VANPGGALSGAVTLYVYAVTQGAVERESVATDGTPANSDADSALISPNGRFVAFQAYGTGLAPEVTVAQTHVYLRDTCRGAGSGCTPSTILISAASDGTPGNGSSSASVMAMTPDGRYVTFASAASNLVANDTNGSVAYYDIFVRDTCLGAPAGCTPSTTRASVATDGTEANQSSDSPAISAEGRYVTFDSYGSNLGATINYIGVFVRDTCAGVASGCTPSTTLESTDGTFVYSGYRPVISADGRYVAFDTSNQVYVRDTCTGAVSCTPALTLVSAAADGSELSGQNYEASMSADGRYIAFVNYRNFGSYSEAKMVIRDTCIGAPAGCTPASADGSVGNDGVTDKNIGNGPSLSANGRFLAFMSSGTLGLSGDTNNGWDIFVRDTCAGATGCTPSTARVTTWPNGVQMSGYLHNSTYGITADGHFVVFSVRDTTHAWLPGNYWEIWLALTGW
jgi:Tol biopolymer transport system component